MAKKKTLRERLAEKQEDLKRSGQGGKFFLIKEGKTRMRPLFCGEEEDWALEVIVFYLGKDLGFIISPATFNEKCAIKAAQSELADSKKESEREFAKKFRPSKRFAIPCIRYNDEKGQELDEKSGAKLLIASTGIYNEMLNLYLDDEAGDFTLPLEGYDIKFKRVGKTLTDTEYSMIKCNPTKCPKAFRGPYNVEEMVRAVMPSYKETKTLLEKFLSIPPEDDEDDKPTKKKKKSKDL